jgi:hypothetical protein
LVQAVQERLVDGGLDAVNIFRYHWHSTQTI